MSSLSNVSLKKLHRVVGAIYLCAITSVGLKPFHSLLFLVLKAEGHKT